MLEDCDSSQEPVRVQEPHFKVFPEFINSSYSKRYELLCRKLVLERQYTNSSFITSRRDTGLRGKYNEPAKDLLFSNLATKLAHHVAGYAK